MEFSSLCTGDGACCVVCKRWNDFQLVWQPEHYGNVTYTRVPISKLWYPDLVIINRCAHVMLCVVSCVKLQTCQLSRSDALSHVIKHVWWLAISHIRPHFLELLSSISRQN